MKIQAVLLFLVISIIHCTCLSQVIYGRRELLSLLLQFKNDFTFDPFTTTKLSSWNEGTTPCCDWSGVTCDHHARVIAFDLGGQAMYGALDNSSSLFGLQHLPFLNLAENSFNSSIPSGFNKLNLTHLSGPMPPFFSNLVNLLDLIFPQTTLVDDDALSTFSQLHTLNLASCKLKMFPRFLRPNPKFSIRPSALDFSNNDFSGVIPKDIGDNLGVFNLGSNELTGHIPNTFPSSCVLQTTVLNGNQLVGPIPKSLEHCTSLEVLDVGRNQIVGVFPCFLSHISTLRVLVFRNNKFHDPMGCHKENSVWNKIQIVDVAFNNFSGVLSVKWFRGWKMMMSNAGEAQCRIPTGIQVQSFEASSFEGNDGLFETPLTKTPNHGMQPLPPPSEMPPCGSLACEVHWDLVSTELGLVFGLGSIIGPLLF
ncbi:hypothetical protein PIB30_060659 [Stylosanthes scabra]|uniref:Leucine-rich repeat-containing N-terminal plant-type domain-containing protein n=1 Tax=Stylosanthes scabra TaxID=79078 RepID=A0ABU6VK61_9FABA|nr:hypothetical protein [Stylosanthes scabra]